MICFPITLPQRLIVAYKGNELLKLANTSFLAVINRCFHPARILIIARVMF